MVKAPRCVFHSSSLQFLLHPIPPPAPPAVPFTHFSSHNRCVPRPGSGPCWSPSPTFFHTSASQHLAENICSQNKRKAHAVCWIIKQIRIRCYNGINFLPNLFSQLLPERTRNMKLFSRVWEIQELKCWVGSHSRHLGKIWFWKSEGKYALKKSFYQEELQKSWRW